MGADNCQRPDPTQSVELRYPRLARRAFWMAPGVGSLAIISSHLWPSTFFFGWTRVDLFFVLSGYLITRIVLTHGEGTRFLTRFWARRALRTWPVYYLALAVVCAAMHWTGKTPTWNALLLHISFSHNICYTWSDKAPSLDPSLLHTWALAVEEQFYVIWPVVARLISRRLITPLITFIILTSVTARLSGVHAWSSIARCDGLGFGAMLAAIFDGEPRISSRAARSWLFAAAIFAATGFLVWDSASFSLPIRAAGPALTIFAVNVLFFGLVGLTIHHTGRPPLRPLRCGTLRYVGQISYGVYIFHFLILEKYEEFRPQTGTAICFDVLALLICLLVGALSWELLEKPLSRLKRRLAYERATEHALGSV